MPDPREHRRETRRLIGEMHAAGVTAADIARRLEVSTDYVSNVVEACAAAGLFAQTADAAHPTVAGRTLVTGQAAARARWVECMVCYHPACDHAAAPGYGCQPGCLCLETKQKVSGHRALFTRPALAEEAPEPATATPRARRRVWARVFT